MADHLWPEYLRQGTPVIDMSGRRLCIASIRPDQIVAVGHAPGSQGVMTTRGTGHGGGFALDLRDTTARAHAAWAWTRAAPTYVGRGAKVRDKGVFGEAWVYGQAEVFGATKVSGSSLLA